MDNPLDGNELTAAMNSGSHDFVTMLERAPAGVFQADRDGNIVYFNTAAQRLTGVPGNHVNFSDWLAAVHEEDRPNVIESLEQFRREVRSGMFTCRFLRPDGSTIWLQIEDVPTLDEAGAVLGFIGVATDVTAEREHILRIESLSRFYATLSQVNAAIVRCTSEQELYESICQVATTRGGFVGASVYARDTEKNTAYSVVNIVPHGVSAGEHPVIIDLGTEAPWTLVGEAMRSEKVVISEDMQVDQRLDPHWRDVAKNCGLVGGCVVPLSRRGAIVAALAFYVEGREYRDPDLLALIEQIGRDVSHAIENITSRSEFEERISHLAYVDALTGLPNRTLLRDRVAQGIAAANREDSSVAMLFIDLDHFKNINDSLGHAVGDRLLTEIAKRLTGSVREMDTVGRLGGDEFLVVLPDANAEAAAYVAQKLLKESARPIVFESHSLTVTPSIGIALYPRDGRNFDDLLKTADTAMYRAKDDGRNIYRFLRRK